jgi:hypothetical protein
LCLRSVIASMKISEVLKIRNNYIICKLRMWVLSAIFSSIKCHQSRCLHIRYCRVRQGRDKWGVIYGGEKELSIPADCPDRTKLTFLWPHFFNLIIKAHYTGTVQSLVCRLFIVGCPYYR